MAIWRSVASLGYQLYGHELMLHDFADFAQRNSVDTVTIELAVRVGSAPEGHQADLVGDPARG